MYGLHPADSSSVGLPRQETRRMETIRNRKIGTRITAGFTAVIAIATFLGLFERSQTAAGEIKSLTIEGVKVAEGAGQLLAKLVPDIKRTAELLGEISAATSEQNTGASQINEAIQQLDQVIQQNAGSSEAMAATAEELSSQAESLQASIAFFKTGDATVLEPTTAKRLAGLVQRQTLGQQPGQNQQPPRSLK